MQAGELIARSLRQNLDTAVVIIANPSGDTQQVRLAFHEPAKTHTLHTPANDVAASFSRFLRGSHRSATVILSEKSASRAKLIRRRRIPFTSILSRNSPGISTSD